MKRRTFIRNTAMATLPFIYGLKPAEIRLSFSTLGCPDWSFEQITDFAVKHGYHGIEIRGILRELDLPKAAPFNGPEKIRETLKLMQDKNLAFVDLGSAAALHHPPGETRNKQLDGAKRFIDLAAALRCPYIRVFPDKFPKDQEKSRTIDLIVEGLRLLGNYAGGTAVTVLMETHGEVLYADDLVSIIKKTNHPQTALVWDMVNMWIVTKESPAEVYPKLKPWIKHVHIKDLRTVNGKHEYTLLGEGETPMFEAIDLLHKNGYDGYYSLEWEKLWNPEIAPPEIAFADFAEKMKKKYPVSRRQA